MWYYCWKNYEDKFVAGNYYWHLGAREMVQEYKSNTVSIWWKEKHHPPDAQMKVVGFGKLKNWERYFLTPENDRNRKLETILENTEKRSGFL